LALVRKNLRLDIDVKEGRHASNFRRFRRARFAGNRVAGAPRISTLRQNFDLICSRSPIDGKAVVQELTIVRVIPHERNPRATQVACHMAAWSEIGQRMAYCCATTAWVRVIFSRYPQRFEARPTCKNQKKKKKKKKRVG